VHASAASSVSSSSSSVLHARRSSPVQQHRQRDGAIQREIADVKAVMAMNIDKVLDRGDRLEDLQSKSQDLAESSVQFKKKASSSGGGILSSISNFFGGRKSPTSSTTSLPSPSPTTPTSAAVARPADASSEEEAEMDDNDDDDEPKAAAEAKSGGKSPGAATKDKKEKEKRSSRKSELARAPAPTAKPGGALPPSRNMASAPPSRSFAAPPPAPSSSSSSRSSSSPTAAPVGGATGGYQGLIQSQKFDGSWLLDVVITRGGATKSAGDVTAAFNTLLTSLVATISTETKTEHKINSDEVTKETAALAGTLLALAMLHTKFPDKRAEWMILMEKARAFVTKRLNRCVTPVHDWDKRIDDIIREFATALHL
jgi:hypothetical protein